MGGFDRASAVNRVGCGIEASSKVKVPDLDSVAIRLAALAPLPPYPPKVIFQMRKDLAGPESYLSDAQDFQSDTGLEDRREVFWPVERRGGVRRHEKRAFLAA
jgi:hypothetical protein